MFTLYLYALYLYFSGSVIGPTFHFDVPKLKFGTVSYGEFIKTSELLSRYYVENIVFLFSFTICQFL